VSIGKNDRNKKKNKFDRKNQKSLLIEAGKHRNNYI
jgi:hypothetical protein